MLPNSVEISVGVRVAGMSSGLRIRLGLLSVYDAPEQRAQPLQLNVLVTMLPQTLHQVFQGFPFCSNAS